MGIQKTNYYIKIKTNMPNLSQEPPASFKTPNQDSKDIYVLWTFKIKLQSQILEQIESRNLEHGYIKDQRLYPNQDQDTKPQSGTSSILQNPQIRT